MRRVDDLNGRKLAAHPLYAITKPRFTIRLLRCGIGEAPWREPTPVLVDDGRGYRRGSTARPGRAT